MNVLDYCLKINDAIPEDICDEIINIFDSSEKKSRLERGGYPNWTYLFTQDIENEHKDLINKKITEQCQNVLLSYKKYLGEYGNYFNSHDFNWEGANIKCYQGGTDDKYGYHADVSSLSTSKRFLAMIWYLNDNFDGGETVFYPDCKIKPAKGSVLVFPPFWMYPHCGKPVLKGKKYILSNYCLWSHG